MEVREAIESDIPQIVNLLKLSLGESLMPKSEAYWRWKHINNPFGKSPVLLAVDNGKIIGVRAFLRWEWKKGDCVLKAVRAVDTATHPDYQGRGVFKELTLRLVEECTAAGTDLIFNTPNKSSMPGYLKMGWQEVGNLSVGIGIKRPLNILKSILMSPEKVEFLEKNELKLKLVFDRQNELNDRNWTTNYSERYLKWRYEEIPLIRYYSITRDQTCVIFRLIRNKKGVELRIVDVFGDLVTVKSFITNLQKSIRSDYLSISGNNCSVLSPILKKSFQIGPNVTIRKLNYAGSDFSGFENWEPSLGDLEVF